MYDTPAAPSVLSSRGVLSLAKTNHSTCVFRTWVRKEILDNTNQRTYVLQYTKLAPLEDSWCAEDGNRLLSLAVSPNTTDVGVYFAAVRSAEGVDVYRLLFRANYTTVKTTRLLRLSASHAVDSITAIDVAQGPTMGFWFSTQNEIVLQTLYPPRVQRFTLDAGVKIHRIDTTGITMAGNILVLFTTANGTRCSGDLQAGHGKAWVGCDAQPVNEPESPDIWPAYYDEKAGPGYVEFKDRLTIRSVDRIGKELIFPQKYAAMTPDWVNTSTRRFVLTGASWHI